MADENKIGVDLETGGTDEFNKAMQRYMDTLLKAEKTTDAFVVHMNKLSAGLDRVLGASSGLDKAAKEVMTFKNSLAAVSKALPDVKPLNKFFSDIAKGAAVLKPVESTVRSLSSLNRSIVALSQATPISSAVIDSLKALEPVVTSLGSIPTLRPVARSIADLGLALERFSVVGDKPKAALDTLTSLGVRLKTIAQNSQDIRRVSAAISLIARAMQGFQGIKGIPANALASLGAIANALRAVSQVAGVKDAANQIALVSRALARFADIKSIPTQSIAAIGAISNALRSVSQLSGIDKAAKAISGIGLALSRLSNIQTIPAKALASIGAIGNALRSVSGIANVAQLSQGLLRLSTALNRLSTVKAVPPHVFQNLQALVRSLGGIGTGSNIAALVGVTNALTTALNKLTAAQARAIPQLNSFRTSFTQGIAIGVGAQAVDMFLRLGGAIRDFVSSTLGTVAFFERFNLTLEAVIAQQLKAADSSLTQAQAIEQAKRPALGYLKILEQMAILSPFNIEQVALGFRLATAFGFTTKEALRLTQAVVDFTSFAGLGNEALERISRSLAQVRNRGKLTADNVRELAEAGVPVYDILGKAFKKTTAELLDFQEDGAIPAGQAIQAIIGYFEEVATGAGKKAATTLTGLLATLGEIKQIAARDIFGTAFQSIQPILQELVSFLSSNQFRASLVVIGQIIGANLARAIQTVRAAINGLISSYNALNPRTKEAIKTFILVGAAVVSLIAIFGAVSLVIGALVNPFTLITVTVTGLVTLWVTSFDRIQSITTTVLSSIGKAFDILATQATNWGISIIRSLTAGVVGATGLIAQALRVVGQVFSFFLKPGSPPRLLPDLDTWGTAAANEYISAWTKADFDELNKFGSVLANQIRNLVSIGNIDELSAPRRIIGTRQALSQALSDIKSFGVVTENTLTRIFNATLLNRNLLRSYFDSYAQLTRATSDLEKAQDSLNATMKQYDDQLKPLQKRLQEITDAQDNAEEQKQIARLQRIIANRGANDSRRSSALLELEQIQVENQIEALEREKGAAEETGSAVVNELQRALDQAKENLAINEARINNQIEINSLIGEEARIRRQLEEELAKQKDPRIVALERELEIFTLQQGFLSNLIDLAHQQFILSDAEATAAQKKTAELRIQELLIDNQIKTIEGAKLGIDFGPLFDIPIVPADFGVKIDGITESIGGMFDSFAGLETLDLETPIKDFEKAVEDATKSISDFNLAITTTLDNINKKLPPFLRFQEVAGDPRPSTGLKNLGAALTGIGVAITVGRVISLLGAVAGVLAGTASVATIVPALIGLVAAAFVGDWFGFRTGVVEQFHKDWETTRAIFDAILLAGSEIRTLFAEEGISGVVRGFFETVNAAFSDFFALIVSSFPEEMQTFFNETLPEIIQIGFDLGAGLVQGIRDFFSTSNTVFSTLFNELILQPIKDYFGVESPSTLMRDKVGDPAGLGVIVGMVNAIGAGIVDVVTALGDLAAGMFSLESIQVFLDHAKTLGTDIILGIKEGLTTKYEETKGFFQGLLGGLFGAGEEEIESGSPSKRAHRDLGEPIGEGVLGGLKSSLSETTLGKIFADALVIFNAFRDAAVTVTNQLQIGVTASFTLLEATVTKAIEATKTSVITAIGLTAVDIAQKSIAFRTAFLQNVLLMKTKGLLTINAFKIETVRIFVAMQKAITGESGIIPVLTDKVVTLFEDMSAAVIEIVANMITTLTEQFTGENGLTTTLEVLFADKGTILGETFGNGIAQGIINKLEPIKNAALFVIQQALLASLAVINAQPTASSSGLQTQGVNDRLGSPGVGNTTPVVGGGNITKVYNLNVNSTQSSRGIVRDFGIMEVMGA